jgi:hypothetical protein
VLRLSETNAEIKTAPATTIPNSLNKLPTKPCINTMGKNTIANVIEVDMTAKKISSEPSIVLPAFSAFRILVF